MNREGEIFSQDDVNIYIGRFNSVLLSYSNDRKWMQWKKIDGHRSKVIYLMMKRKFEILKKKKKILREKRIEITHNKSLGVPLISISQKNIVHF